MCMKPIKPNKGKPALRVQSGKQKENSGGEGREECGGVKDWGGLKCQAKEFRLHPEGRMKPQTVSKQGKNTIGSDIQVGAERGENL